MLKVGRILRDYQEAESVNALLAPWGFLDDRTFLTKAGDVGVIYRITGVDYECLDQTQRRDVVHRFEAALRLFDERFRVYQHLRKRRVRPLAASRCANPLADEAIQRHIAHLNARRDALYELDIFLTVVHEDAGTHVGTSTRLGNLLRQPREALRRWLSTNATIQLLEEELDRAVARLHERATAFEVQLADSIRPLPLDKGHAFEFLRHLLNYRRDTAEGRSLKYDAHLDFFAADTPIECHRSHLDLDGVAVKVLTMKEPPSTTFAHVLENLYTVPGEFIACLEWCRIPNDRIRRELQMRRRHFFNKRVSLVNYVAPETKAEEMLVDESATNLMRQHGEALTEIEANGHFFGECSFTIALFDEDSRALARAAAEAGKVFAAHDGALIEETYNLLNAWLAIVPGNRAHNLRRLALLETNCADLSLLFALDRGDPVSPHLQREALAVLETQHQTPYFFNLHVGDVGHTVVLGVTGGGKSFSMNFFTLHAQKYEPLTVIFDLGHSYRKLATLFDGSYVELGLRQQGVTINPFSLPPTPENLHFLHAFVRVLLEGADSYRLSDAEDRELYEAIENLYVLDAEQRRLFTLANLLPRSLSARLSKWIESGRYAALFDNLEDTLSVQRFQVFEFEAMRAYPDLLEALLFYVLHRVSAAIQECAAEGRLTLCVMDEAWRFIQHERLRDYVQEALKTWRKRNAAMLLATQTIDDFASADLLRTVVESCPTKLLLANPAMDRARYAQLFQLNETELDLLADLIPRRQMLLKRPDVAKVLNLLVDPKSYWLYTNTPIDNERVSAMFQKYGFEAGLDRLAASA